MKKQRILITGSSGMLGTDLCYKCLEKYEVYGVDIIEPKTTDSIKFFKLDITNRSEIIEFIKRIKPNLVIHTAAYTDVDGCEESKEKAFNINAGGTQNVALGCKHAGSLLFYISTDFVFDGKKSAPYTEEDLPNPINIYGESKLKGEKFIEEILEKFVIVRSSWLFGKYGTNFVNTILESTKREKEIEVVTDQIGSPTYTKDLATAIIKLAECIIDKSTFGLYHITNSGSISWHKYAEEIMEYANIVDVKIIPITSGELNRLAKRPEMSILDRGRYQKTTGDKMRNYKEALKEYILRESIYQVRGESS